MTRSGRPSSATTPVVALGQGSSWSEAMSDIDWSDGDLLVFLRRDEASKDSVVVAVNRGTEPATASFDAPAEWGDAPVKDEWTGSEVPRSGGRIEITVAPRDASILAAGRKTT